MKITKTQLKQIIKEELSKVLEIDSTPHSFNMGEKGFSGDSVAVEIIGNNRAFKELIGAEDEGQMRIIQVDPGVRLQLRWNAQASMADSSADLFLSKKGGEFKQIDSFDFRNPWDSLRATVEKLKDPNRDPTQVELIDPKARVFKSNL